MLMIKKRVLFGAAFGVIGFILVLTFIFSKKELWILAVSLLGGLILCLEEGFDGGLFVGLPFALICSFGAVVGWFLGWNSFAIAPACFIGAVLGVLLGILFGVLTRLLRKPPAPPWR